MWSSTLHFHSTSWRGEGDKAGVSIAHTYMYLHTHTHTLTHTNIHTAHTHILLIPQVELANSSIYMYFHTENTF